MPSLPTLRVALVGCGQIADAHLQEARRTGLATLVAVCDLNPDLARQAAVRFGVPRYECDFDRMLDVTRPDVVHIATPPATHHNLVRRALNAGAHVYVEKPFAISTAETDDLLAMAAARKRLVCVGHDRLFDPAWLEGAERIRRGAIGTVTHMEMFQGYDLEGAFGRLVVSDDRHWVRRLPGGLFQNAIPHALATIAEMIPDDWPEVTASSWSRPPYDFPTDLHVLVRGERMAATVTFVTDVSPAASYARIYGTEGWIEVDYEARATRLRAATSLPALVTRLQAPLSSARQAARALVANTGRLLRADLHYFAGMQHILRSFYTAVGEGGPSPTEPRHIHRVSVLMDEIIGALDYERDGAIQHPAAIS